MKPLVLLETEIVPGVVADGPKKGGVILEMRHKARTQLGDPAEVAPLIMVVRDAETLVEMLQRAIADARGKPFTPPSVKH